jgi:prepilin peptidase CpaA
MTQLYAAGAVVLLGAALVTDIRQMIIPNRLTMPALLLGAIAHIACDGAAGLRLSALGAACGAGMLLALYLMRAVGAGDVKLFAALGAWLGPAAASEVAMYAVIAAGGYGLLTALTWRLFMRRIWLRAGWSIAEDLQRRSGWIGNRIRMPFMLAVCPGAAAMWLMG